MTALEEEGLYCCYDGSNAVTNNLQLLFLFEFYLFGGDGLAESFVICACVCFIIFIYIINKFYSWNSSSLWTMLRTRNRAFWQTRSEAASFTSLFGLVRRWHISFW